MKGLNLKLIVEPGSSLVANTSIFVSRVTGVRSDNDSHFIVIDGYLSGDNHQIEFAEPIYGSKLLQSVISPESSQTLVRDRELPVPSEGDILVVLDAGAPC